MKKLLCVIVLVAVLAMAVGSNLGYRVIGIHPVAFMAAVEEDLPESGFDLFGTLTEFYDPDKNQSLGDRIFWFGNVIVESTSFPVKAAGWLFLAMHAFWGNMDVLFEFQRGGN